MPQVPQTASVAEPNLIFGSAIPPALCACGMEDNMAQANVLQNDIVHEHRVRMLNLKKYYPFFKLTEISFENFRQGQYADLDMGYIVMAVLRFFIEENNFKEKDVTYPEYVEFIGQCIRRDFVLNVTDEECRDIADYVFDKIKNDGKPFEFGYYDPVDRKHKVSRMKLIDSSIRNNTVWYSISPDAIEFYLDTKEIKDESRISVQQLLLEKMIKSQDFGRGTQVVGRINDEVERLMLERREVERLLATDVFAGLEAYRDFTDNGMQWFDDEQRLFVKNKELIDAAIAKMESTPAHAGDGYRRAVDEIYELDDQLKMAMSRHGELLRACMDLQKLTDNVIHRNKLSRLRIHCDYRQLLEQMVRSDTTRPLEMMIGAMLRPKTSKMFDFGIIDECLTQRTQKQDIVEEDAPGTQEDIIFADEAEDERISHNYIFFMRSIIRLLEEKQEFTLSWYNAWLKDRYKEKADNILANADYYSFLVNLCQKRRYVIGGPDDTEESFLDGILKEGLAADGAAGVNGNPYVIEIEMADGEVEVGKEAVVSELIFRLARTQDNGGSDGTEES